MHLTIDIVDADCGCNHICDDSSCTNKAAATLIIRKGVLLLAMSFSCEDHLKDAMDLPIDAVRQALKFMRAQNN